MDKHPFGAWAAFLALVSSFFLAVLSAGAQEPASQPGQAQRAQTLSAFEQEYEKGNYAQCESLLQDILKRYPKAPKKARFELQLGRAYVIQPGGDLAKARVHLEKFLPSGPYAQSDCAIEAQPVYAQLLIKEGKLAEAKQVLEGLSGSDKTSLVRRAFERANGRGFIESPEEIARWTSGLEAAASRAQEHVQGGQQWVQQAQGQSEQQKRQALLETDTKALPALQDGVQKLSQRNQGEDRFDTLRRQATGKFRSAKALAEAGKSTEAYPVWQECERLREQALEALPAFAPPGSSGALDARQLEARVALAVARSGVGKISESRSLFQEVAAYAADPRIVGDPDMEIMVAEARLWLAAYQQADGGSPATVRQSITAVLQSCECTPDELSWSFLRLAAMARAERDTRAEALYLKDLQESLPIKEKTALAVERLGEIYQGDPSLEASLGGAHSDAYQAMAANAKVATGANGKPVFKFHAQGRKAVSALAP